MLRRLLLLGFVTLVARAAQAGPPASFIITPLASGFDTPTAFAFAPDGRVFVTEKSGVVLVVDGGGTHVFYDIHDEVNEYGDRGLLGLALDPQFAANHRLYLFFIEELQPGDPDDATAAEGRVIRIDASSGDPNAADPATRVTLLAGFDNHHYSHSGGCLRFDAAGHLLVTFGDGSSYNEVDAFALHTYDLDMLTGKLVRIDPATGDGVPGNPYYDAADPGAVHSKVLARGFRNPFRFGIEPASGDVYVGDVGWNDWEEVNRVPLAWSSADLELNLGWPCYEGGNGALVHQPGYENDASTVAGCQTIYPPSEGGTGIGATAAVYAYQHSDPGGDGGSAVIGGVFYQGTGGYPPTYTGRYVFGDYARDRFQTLTPAGIVEDFGSPGGWNHPVDIQLAPDGNVAYLAIGIGVLNEIVFVGGNQPPHAVAVGAPLVGPAPLKVQFDGTASTDPDGDKVRYLWTFGDGRKAKVKRPRHRFRTAGTYTVTLTVSDRRKDGLTDSTTLTVNVGNTPPTIAFASPVDGQGYAVGDTLPIAFALSDGESPTSDLVVQWRALIHHIGHLHYLPLNTSQSGSFRVPDHGDDSYLEFEATVTDPQGASSSATITLSPTTAPIIFDTSPSGLELIVDGQAETTPYTRQSILNGGHSVTAPTNGTLGATSYAFTGWASGETQTYGFVTPAGGMSDVASYAAQ